MSDYITPIQMGFTWVKTSPEKGVHFQREIHLQMVDVSLSC